MMTSFNITIDKKDSPRFLVRKTNEFFTGNRYQKNSVIAPNDKNYVIHLNKFGINVTIVEDDDLDDTLIIFKEYLEKFFSSKTIGVRYNDSKFKTFFENLVNVKTIDL